MHRRTRVTLLGLLGLTACSPPPTDHGPDKTVFPYVYTPESGLKDYEPVRWETETWNAASDQKMAALYLKKLFFHKRSAPQEVLTHFDQMRGTIPPLVAGDTKLSFAGDVMWVGGNWSAFATPAAALLDGDLRVANLETPTSPDHPNESLSLGLYAFNAPTTMLDALPFDVLQLTNNHSLDADDKGLENTLREVKAQGYQQTGIDEQLITTVAGRKVALLAYTWGTNDQRRSKQGHELHIVPFGHLDEDIDLALVTRQIAEARAAGAELVVTLVHWGFEFEFYPDPHFLVLGRRLVSAGADLVVGQGPHVVQPAELCQVNRDAAAGIGTCSLRTTDGRPRTAAILYSLGDFGTTLPTIETKTGIVATVSFGDEGISGLGWAAVHSERVAADQGGGQKVRPLAELKSDTVLMAEAERLVTHLGAGWRR